MKYPHFSRGVLVAALVASVAACSKQNDPAKSAAAVPAKSTPAALPVLGPAPAWKLKDVAGNVVSSEQFKGKVVVVDFWATWCGPCKMEIPGYVALQKKYGKDRLAIIGVSVDQEGPGVVKAFIEKQGINYQMVMNDDAVTSAFGAMDAIPTTFLIDRDGQVRDRKVGVEPTEDYEQKIASLLN
jgi:peroxiredoxin